MNEARTERLLREDTGRDEPALVLVKVLAIGAVSVLAFGLSPLAGLAFVVGIALWLLARTTRLALATFRRLEEVDHHCARLNQRLAELEHRRHPTVSGPRDRAAWRH